MVRRDCGAGAQPDGSPVRAIAVTFHPVDGRSDCRNSADCRHLDDDALAGCIGLSVIPGGYLGTWTEVAWGVLLGLPGAAASIAANTTGLHWPLFQSDLEYGYALLRSAPLVWKPDRQQHRV